MIGGMVKALNKFKRLYILLNIIKVGWERPLRLHSVVCVCMCMHAWSVTQSCPALCDSRDRSPPGSSFPGISQARILEWIAIFLCQGIFLTQGLNPCLLYLLYWQAGSYHWTTWEAHVCAYPYKIIFKPIPPTYVYLRFVQIHGVLIFTIRKQKIRQI